MVNVSALGSDQGLSSELPQTASKTKVLFQISFFQCFQAFHLSTPTLQGALGISLLHNTTAKPKDAASRPQGLVRDPLQDQGQGEIHTSAELSTYHSQVPKTQAQKNGERQNKPQFSSFSFIFPPQEVKGYGLCKNTASKLTIKISGTSNFPLGTSGTAFVFVLWVVPENNTEE